MKLEVESNLKAEEEAQMKAKGQKAKLKAADEANFMPEEAQMEQ